MAAKQKTVYVCTACGYRSPTWNGQCPDCGEWNTLEEELVSVSGAKNGPASAFSFQAQKLSDISEQTEHRYDTGISELNRVLGGGLVKGSLVLISGDPGI